MLTRRRWLAGITLALAACGRSPDRGVPIGLALEGDPIAAEALSGFRERTGLPARLAVIFLSWPASREAFHFPRESLARIRAAGATPVLTWEPWVFDSGPEPRVIAGEAILRGEWDWYLHRFADEVLEFGSPVWIRFAHEMNTTRYHWGCPDLARFDAGAPERYRAMFRHIVDQFMARGVHNSRWVFCANAESVPLPNTAATAWNRAANFFPGPDYVDVLGLDGYNWGTSQTRARHGWDSRWMSFEEIFSPGRDELLGLAPERPLVIFETACATVGGDKSAWVEAMTRTARQWALDGLVWFDIDKETDWRLLTGLTPAALTALRRLDAPLPPGLA